MNSRDRGQFRQDKVRCRFEKNYRETIGKTQEIMGDKTVQEHIGITLKEITVMTEGGIGLERGHFQGTMTVIDLEVQTIVDQG